jgi:hypothetical protein
MVWNLDLSNGSHQKVTEILGREPSDAWSEGDPRPRKGYYQFMCWRLNSGYNDREPLERSKFQTISKLSWNW